MIASILWDVDPVWFKVGSWEVRWYGLMWSVAFSKKKNILKTG
jgi:phosphatidylglycerol:prolipoprotein diacylglycerol transferase